MEKSLTYHFPHGEKIDSDIKNHSDSSLGRKLFVSYKKPLLGNTDTLTKSVSFKEIYQPFSLLNSDTL